MIEIQQLWLFGSSDIQVLDTTHSLRSARYLELLESLCCL